MRCDKKIPDCILLLRQRYLPDISCCHLQSSSVARWYRWLRVCTIVENICRSPVFELDKYSMWLFL